MTNPFPFPTDFDLVAAAVLRTPLPRELPRHRAILDAALTVQRLDAQIFGPDSPTEDEVLADADLAEEITGLLVDRLAAGRQLALLLSATSCPCNASDDGADDAPDPSDEGPEFLSCPAGPQSPGVLDAALGAFADFGNPDALASADLVNALRTRPGTAEGRWRYADLTPARLAQLLAPYEIQSRDITLPDGRRRKAYRLSALRSAADR
ncbi:MULTISPECIES: DUF3631 domain-containing protein [Streptomyces]|uniref:DUF3631 domain-containing protein n=1 Tax=Streptomyces tsukubensis (strain DSM 42081 / NBRC 108919 / NRRL 18488 / 9993) TaxID=1114943 RepID=I2N7V5_STRT9|nr:MULTISPECIES: DUF3631 domain-containing protein [Streptomyces]AZK97059.1 hypothetical protein B7R87_26700 [Streptomyces tsukubensis]EIF93102.1 hypothetical protein [Streptomyces tsukubensis NRRL18488]MYS66498.1 DUF3631 domain-containing protein [Streptomyces sp. SID5473]QKM66969.1 DUF3631 domain-containing protein [Streptomyces tsukubensis NRRL18488]TAI41554.1 DUF3631 domain-containing protein [Streptomyces tsukubensis]